MSFSKYVMIVKLEMRAGSKILVRFMSKNYQRHHFSKYVVCDQERDGVRRDGKSWGMFLKQTSNIVIGI